MWSALQRGKDRGRKRRTKMRQSGQRNKSRGETGPVSAINCAEGQWDEGGDDKRCNRGQVRFKWRSNSEGEFQAPTDLVIAHASTHCLPTLSLSSGPPSALPTIYCGDRPLHPSPSLQFIVVIGLCSLPGPYHRYSLTSFFTVYPNPREL